MNNWRILCTLDLSGAPEAVAALQAAGSLDLLPPDRGQVLAFIDRYDAYMAHAAVRIDREFLARARRLRVIGSPSTGKDHMDMSAIAAANITMYDIATEFDLIRGFTATSECAFGLLLSVIRKLPPAVAAASAGDWARERFTGFQLYGKTLGVLGLGRLGTISARIGAGFGMKVIAHDVRPASAPGVEMVSFDELLRRSDVVTIHVHLEDATRRLIDAAAFAKLKHGAVLINTSRGGLIDEAALIEALDSGKVAGAGLDVIDGEWIEDKTNHPLIAYSRGHDNLVITPHIGGATLESIYGARVFMARKLADHIRGAGAPSP